MGRKPDKTGTARRFDLTNPPPPDSVRGQHYYYVTQRPWPSLVFVLPMLLIFEVGTFFRRGEPGGGNSELVATHLIDALVHLLGAGGFYFPGLLAVAILLAWHLAAKHPWRFDPSVLLGMLGESLLWTIPLFVFENALQNEALTSGGGLLSTLWADRVVRSLGAGIYEELVFRLVCITLLVIVLIDMLRLPRSAATVFIILFSAAVFAAQHHLPFGMEPFRPLVFLFRTAAGIYLAGLFFLRGFGIAVGCHAFYNVLVVTLESIE